jgi:hypothetical protein
MHGKALKANNDALSEPFHCGNRLQCVYRQCRWPLFHVPYLTTTFESDVQGQRRTARSISALQGGHRPSAASLPAAAAAAGLRGRSQGLQDASPGTYAICLRICRYCVDVYTMRLALDEVKAPFCCVMWL